MNSIHKACIKLYAIFNTNGNLITDTHCKKILREPLLERAFKKTQSVGYLSGKNAVSNLASIKNVTN